MKSLILALAYSSIFGNAPFCAYDGFNYSCYYYSWAACEQAVAYNPAARCVVHP